MKTAQQQLATYKSVHLSKYNVRTHFIGVPAIIWSLTLLMSLWSIPIGLLGQTLHISLAMMAFSLIIVYYFILHWRLAIGLVLFIIPTIYSASLLADYEHAYLIAIGVFVIGWIFQFIGHVYEKARPAFMDDLNQLLIGPFFLMAEVYFMLGLEKQLEQIVTPMAIEKRRALETARRG